MREKRVSHAVFLITAEKAAKHGRGLARGGFEVRSRGVSFSAESCDAALRFLYSRSSGGSRALTGRTRPAGEPFGFSLAVCRAYEALGADTCRTLCVSADVRFSRSFQRFAGARAAGRPCSGT